MKPGLKRGIKLAALLLVAVLAVPVVAIGSAFVGHAPIEDGLELEGVARVVKDGYVSLAVLDVGGGKVALVDAGNDAAGKAILAELSRRKLGPEAVTAIFITHGHADHTAGCHLFPAATIYALAGDVALAEGREAMHSPLGKLIGLHDNGTRITRALTDGETVRVGSRAVQVFALPGHTPGSAAYLVDGVLFLGDSAGASSSGKLDPAPYVFSDDQAQNRASLGALGDRLRPRAAEVKAMVPSHSGVLRGLTPLLTFSARR